MKKLFYLLFCFLNFLLTPIVPILSVSFIVIFIALNKHSSNEFILKENLFGLSLIVSLFLYYVSRLFIFPLIYKFSKDNPYISKFFKRIRHEKVFRIKVLLFSILADMAVILAFLSEALLTDINSFLPAFILFTLIGGGGVFISYLALIIWFRFKKIK